MPPLRPVFFSSPLRRPATLPRTRTIRFQTTSSTPADPKTLSRIDRVLSRLPKFIQPWTSGLRSAPGSNVVAFLILHELTAIVPLFGLAGLFHYTSWLPTVWGQGQGRNWANNLSQSWTEARYIVSGTEKFGRYFARKNWFGFTNDQYIPRVTKNEVLDSVEKGKAAQAAEKRWHVSQQSGRILVEVATAYAITKLFLPARILCSVWATPWFARVVVGRVGGNVGRWIGRRQSTDTATATALRNAAEKGASIGGRSASTVKSSGTKS